MKQVTLKVNGSLYIGNDLPENFGSQLREATAFVEGMEAKAGKIKQKEIVLDKDIEFQGDVYAEELTIPDNVRFSILCAGEFGCGYLEKSTNSLSSPL